MVWLDRCIDYYAGISSSMVPCGVAGFSYRLVVLSSFVVGKCIHALGRLLQWGAGRPKD